MSSVGNEAAEMPHLVPTRRPTPTAPPVQLPGSVDTAVKPPSWPRTIPQMVSKTSKGLARA